MKSARLMMLALVASATLSCAAGAQTLERVCASGAMRVCIWPDCYAVTHRNPRAGQLGCIDIALSGELARELQAKVECVESSFPQLAAARAFTAPYLQSGIHGVTTRANRTVRQCAGIDQPGVVAH